jgi:aryl-phospho-beta-D-glucosidase BglC (GH1 family)
VDYPVLESDDAIGVPREDGYAHIDECLKWCADAGLAVILDIHEAPGFTFRNDLEEGDAASNTLFTDSVAQDRFVALWQTIVRRYADAPVPLVFELLNEVTLPDNGPWNALASRTVAAIREVAPEAVVMIGGTHNNAVSGLDGLIEIDDPRVVYTFHTYEPLYFTHQNAPWAAGPREWLAANPQHNQFGDQQVDRRMDREFLADVVAPAVAFARRTGHEVYCGEFGVADWVEPASRRAWLADFLGVLREHGVGFGLWTYKAMDFGLVDLHGNVVDPEYLAIVRGE